jgi:carbohydrate ABC transporter ATP-binding protein
MSEPFVKLCAVSKRFGKIEALKGIDLQIFRDELLVVLGPTGAGKTTLLRTLVGLETPEKGRVLIEGKDSTWLAPAARDMAMVFQEFSLYPDWTVRRNLEFPLRAPGRKETASQSRKEWNGQRGCFESPTCWIGPVPGSPAERCSG